MGKARMRTFTEMEHVPEELTTDAESGYASEASECESMHHHAVPRRVHYSTDNF